MIPPEKKKSPLLALAFGGSSSEEEEPEADHGFLALAKAFGIPPERQAAAQAALKQYVKSCVGSEDDSEEEY